MTEQYKQESINYATNPAALEIDSLQSRNVTGNVPTGTTATMQRPQIPGPMRLSNLTFASVVLPAAAETVTLRLYRIRPETNPSGFGYILLNDPFVLELGIWPGAGVEFDFSSTIRPNLCILPGEYVACSWVHAGPQQLIPLNMNWTFLPVEGNEPEPVATTTDSSVVFG